MGAFSVRANALRLRDRLARKGYDPLIVRARNRSGRWLEHVRMPVTDDYADAVALARRLASSGIESIIVDAHGGGR